MQAIIQEVSMNVKKENKEVKERVTIMMRPSLRAPLQAMADADERSLGFMVERAVEVYLSQQHQPARTL